MRWFAFALIGLASNAAATPLVIERAIVENQPVRTHYLSGVFCWSYRIDIRTDKGKRFPVYDVYLSPAQPIPQRGAVCRIEYGMYKASNCSVVGVKSPRPTDERPHLVPFVTHLSCSAYIK